MNLSKLFETQAALDERIYESHPELKGQDNLDWKVLALQVELGECANEWRGFKKWSHDQEARTYVPNPDDLCKACDGQGYTDKHLDIKDWKFCKECDGCGAHFYNPLLEEYVDCLHFILSIGLEIGHEKFNDENMNEYFKSIHGNRKTDITEQFIMLNWLAGCMYESKIHYEQTLFELINLGENLGFTWEQIEAAYFEKNKINHQRQEANY